jgi:pilus assembly protein CpaF
MTMRIWHNKIGQGAGEVLEHRGDQVRIGRGATNDVVLDSPYVADQAAILSRAGAQWELTALGKNEIRVGSAAIRSGERVLVPQGATITIFPFTINLEAPRPGADEAGDGIDRMDREMSGLILRMHQRLLPRIELTDNAESRRESDEFLQQLELDLEEIARLEGLLERKSSALLTHCAAKCIESHLTSKIIESGDLSNSIWQNNDRWTHMHTQVKEFETELDDIVSQFEHKLKLGEVSDLSERVSRIEKGFWRVWNQESNHLYAAAMQYFALRYLKKQIKDIVFGYGPLEDLLRMPNISEIMVIDSEKLYIEKNGTLEKSGRRFVSDAVTLSIIERIVSRVGRRIDKSQPLVDARLVDGSRVNAVIDPLAISGPCLTIRKFPAKKLLIDDLIAKRSLTPAVAGFLRAAVIAGKNILISGGTGTGKTTMLNCLSDFIPNKERIVTIEDTAELQLQKDHVVRLETKTANVEGSGEYTIRDLVKNALRMRPDRIVVGECRGPEALDMLQAMNTGHDGSMTTIHANTSQDVVLRLEVLVQQAADLPLESIHRQIASAIDLVVQLTRMRDGSRRVTQVTEFVDYDADEKQIRFKDLFVLDQEKRSAELLPTGAVPTFIVELLNKDLVQLDSFFL